MLADSCILSGYWERASLIGYRIYSVDEIFAYFEV